MKMSERLRPGLMLVPMLAVCGPVLAAQEASQPVLSPAGADAVRLLRTLRDPESAGPGPVGLEVSALGTGALDVLFSTLEERRIPDPAGTPEGVQILSEPQQAAILTALENLGRGAVLPRWEERYQAPPEAGDRSAALLVLGAVGEARDLERFWEVAQRPTSSPSDEQPPVELSRAELRDLESSLASLLRRDPGGFERLEDSWSSLPESWLDELVRAAGRTADPECLRLFADLFTWAPSEQRLIASQLPLVGPSDDLELNAELAGALRTLLVEGSKEDVQAAALALAQLEEFSAVSDLVQLLEDPRPGVAGNAHAALVQLTARSLSSSAELWRRWLEDERRWLEREHDATVRRLGSREEHVQLAALKELSRHRLERHELAREASASLFSEHESVRVMAAQVLTELGSRWSSRELLLGLSDSSEAVRLACHAALVRITGVRAGTSPEEWASLRLPEQPY